jgi:hypothetical protein
MARVLHLISGYIENIYAGRVDMISAKTIQLRSNGLDAFQ